MPSAAEAEPRPAPLLSEEDRRLLERLRAGDEAAFMELVERYSGSMLRVARMYVPSAAVAEEVVQETWLGVLRGLDGFEGRSSLKTWIFRILVNRARTRGERERRTVPFATLAGQEASGAEPSVDPERSLQDAEALALVQREIDKLPEMQRLVITMRDVEGWSSQEVRHALEISETNQRVLLHRARSKVRAALEGYFTPT